MGCTARLGCRTSVSVLASSARRLGVWQRSCMTSRSRRVVAVAREEAPGVLWAIQPVNPIPVRPSSDIDPAIPLRARNGDAAAFAEIVEFFHVRCLRYARY